MLSPERHLIGSRNGDRCCKTRNGTIPSKTPSDGRPHPAPTGTTGGVSFCFISPFVRPIAERKRQNGVRKIAAPRNFQTAGIHVSAAVTFGSQEAF